jgi:YegS/Rv2252/BmrU family lipid kinase
VTARPVCVIVNPSSGRGRAARLLPRVEAALRGHGIPHRVERTISLDHARALARKALAREEVAAAFGGDGLLGAVAGELRGTEGVLGVLPGGRGNDFARKLGLGADPVAACAVLAGRHAAALDVADLGGRAYLGIASAGFDSDVQDIATATRVPLRALQRWRPAHWSVQVDGEAHAFRGYSVAVANSGVFGGGMRLVPHAALDDGLLDVVLTRDKPRTHFVVNLPRVFRGSHVSDPGLVFLRGREVAFQADRPFVAYADGDPFVPLPATVRVAHRALRVLVP